MSAIPKIKKLLGAALLIALVSVPAAAQDYVVSVHGIVCELCSYGVARNIRKLPFVDPSRFDKGVDVDIENQVVFVAVSDEATLDKSALFAAIESAGFKPVDINPLETEAEQQGSE